MYKYAGLEKFPEIKYAISDVSDGNMSYFWGEANEVLQNRKAFLKNNGFYINAIVNVHPSDTRTVVEVDKQDSGKGMRSAVDAIEADGTMTNSREIALFLVVADCSPVIIYDPKTSTLGLIHINWKNAPIATAAVEKAVSQFGAAVCDLNIFIGPSIQKESFKFANPIQCQEDNWKEYLENLDNGETNIDMVGYIRNKFLESGILEKNIYVTDIDTYKEKNLFSHYRAVRTGETEGRFAIVVGYATHD